MFGKVTINKSLILSQIIYVVATLPRTRACIINKLNIIILNFLWGCKRDKIKREVVTRSRQEGGLGVVITDDFILSLKFSLIGKIFIQSFSHTWKDIVIKGPSTKDVRQMGRGVVLKFRTFPDGGRGVVCESSDVRKFLKKIDIPKFLRAL